MHTGGARRRTDRDGAAVLLERSSVEFPVRLGVALPVRFCVAVHVCVCVCVAGPVVEPHHTRTVGLPHVLAHPFTDRDDAGGRRPLHGRAADGRR